MKETENIMKSLVDGDGRVKLVVDESVQNGHKTVLHSRPKEEHKTTAENTQVR